MGTMSAISTLSDQELVDQIAKATGWPSGIKDVIDEVLNRWHSLAQQAAQPAAAGAQQATQQGTGGLLTATNVKLEKPAKFAGDAKQLLNFIFEVEQFCNVLGVDQVYESVKLAVTLLHGKALTWWRSVAREPWAQIGLCTWTTFTGHLMQAFQDPNHVLKVKQQLTALTQRTSVQAYNAEFRGLLLEVRSTMSDHDVLFSYLAGLKPQVQQQVMLQSPANVEKAMEVADNADAMFWFSQQAGRKPQNMQQRPRQSFQPHFGGKPQPFVRPQPFARPQPFVRPAQHTGSSTGPVPMELGAVAQQVPNRRQSVGTLSTFKCFACGQPGHLKRNCPMRTGAAHAMSGVSSSFSYPRTPEPATSQPGLSSALPPPPPPKNVT